MNQQIQTALLSPASFWRRVAAFALDTVIFGVFLWLITVLWLLVTYMIWGNATPAHMIAYVHAEYTGHVPSLIIFLLYIVLMEASKKQASLGKMMFGLKVVNAYDEGRITVSKSFLRNLPLCIFMFNTFVNDISHQIPYELWRILTLSSTGVIVISVAVLIISLLMSKERISWFDKLAKCKVVKVTVSAAT